MNEKEQAIFDALPKPEQGAPFTLIKVEPVSKPHPYCITAKHVGYASDHGGVLTTDVIRAAEKAGARCDICRARGLSLTIDEHETSLTAWIQVPGHITNLNDVPGLHAYLKSIKEPATALGIQGFAFPSRH